MKAIHPAIVHPLSPEFFQIELAQPFKQVEQPSESLPYFFLPHPNTPGIITQSCERTTFFYLNYLLSSLFKERLFT